MRLTLSIALAAVLLWEVPRAAAQSPMFLLDSEIDMTTVVFGIDQTTGQLLQLGTLPIVLGEATGLAANGAELLYVSTLLGNIIEIDLNPTFSPTTLGNVGGKLTAMQFHNGLLYVVDELSDELSSVQISPLTKTVIGTIRVGSTMGPVLDIIGGDITRDTAGNWYLFTNATDPMNGKLYSLDLATAVVMEIGPMTWTDGRITGLAFDYGAGDVLYASGRDANKLLTLNPATGAVTASIDVCVSCPTVYDLRAGDLGVPFGTATATATATATGTATETETATPADTFTATATATATATGTFTGTATATATIPPSTSTATATATNPPSTSTATAAPPTATPTSTGTATQTGTVTHTGTVTGTATSTPLRDNGDPCDDPSQCASMICADGVCCNEICDGENESCDQPGREGECVPVTMSPAPAMSWPAAGASVAGLMLVAALRLLYRRRP